VSGSGISWAICKSGPRSRQPCQHPITQIFTGRMPFLPPNQQRQSTEALEYSIQLTVVSYTFHQNQLSALQNVWGWSILLFPLLWPLAYTTTSMVSRWDTRLSWPRHCSNGAQPVPKTAYHSRTRDKHNHLSNFLTLVLSHHSRVHKPLDHCDIALTLTSTPTRIQDTDKQISTRHVLYYTKTWSTKFPKWMKDFPSWFVDYKVHSTANVVTAHQIQ